MVTPKLDKLSGTPPTGRAPQSAHSTIRVLLVSTNKVRAERPYRAQLALAVQNANQYMINTQVPITFEIADFYDIDYSEDGKTGIEQFNDFKLSGRELNTKALQRRAEVHADLMTLYTSWPQTGGQASGIVYSIVGNYPSLAHEYGHNLGAGHGWNGDDRAGYNHGYRRLEDPKFHTIMVTTHGAIPYFSNPRLTYQGVPLGTAKHHDVARLFNERREAVENLFPPLASYSVTLYESENFQGRSCPIYKRRHSPANVTDECGGQPVRSFKLNQAGAGAFCLYDGPGTRHVCYALGASAPKTVEISNIDTAGAPPGVVRTFKGSALAGDVKDLSYGHKSVLLFAEANFKKPICGFPIYLREVLIADQPGCPADVGGKARSALIFNDAMDSTYSWCFYSADHKKTLCLKGKYWGKFGISNFDAATGLPPGFERTQSGGYMNGSVHRIKLDITASPR